MKKVLFVVYAWPPAGGPGVQRCLKFARYLKDFGWEPVVLTVAQPETSAVDDSLVKQIPSDIIVHKTSTIQPFALYKKFTGKASDRKLETGILKRVDTGGWRERTASWFRLNLFVPDAKIGWFPKALSRGKAIVEQENIDLIFSSGPPHTVQLIARALARSKNLPWVADFRDPWTDINYYQVACRSAITNWVDCKLESLCLRSSSATTTVSEGLKVLLTKKSISPKVHLLPNGYDALDLPSKKPQKNDALTIYYGGSLLSEQVPIALLQALSSLKNKSQTTSIRFRLAGYCCIELEDAIRNFGLSHHFEKLGYLQHEEASIELVNADLSLLVINRVPNNECIVTGKIFEYMGARNPILGIGPLHGDAARLLESTGSGRMFDYEDQGGVTRFLQSALDDLPSFRSQFKFDCDQFSRQMLTKDLAKIFDDIVG